MGEERAERACGRSTGDADGRPRNILFISCKGYVSQVSV